jgi:hypothetical protein
MIRLQKLFGKDDQFFSLLDASAEQGRISILNLNTMLSSPSEHPDLSGFHESRAADKRITEQINEALVTSLVKQLEKEDIELLSAALYRIPKSVDKLAERFAISYSVVKGIDFSRHITLLSQATDTVVELVKIFRQPSSSRLPQAKELNAKLQRIEGDADSLILALLKDLYSGEHHPIKVLALRDIYELLENVIDRCRDTGNEVIHIVEKSA